MHFWISAYFFWSNIACVGRPAFSSSLCAMQKLSIKGRPWIMLFTWWMALEVPLASFMPSYWYVKGKAWYSLPYLPVTQASAPDLCLNTPSIFPRFLPFLCPAGEHTSVMQIDSSFSLFFQYLSFKRRWTGTPNTEAWRMTPISDSFASEESGFLKFF